MFGRKGWGHGGSAVLLLISIGGPNAVSAAAPDFTDLSLEELMDVEITSASKKPERLRDTAAAVFVITQEDIRRSGATSIPELLRMVPGVEVARISSNSWAITSRGFNSRFANKLLVLIDGRSVYTPLFSGVFWDRQDTLLEDIDRIEVIRGPGATLWGANAVNGVINIITKSARETQGNLAKAGAGTEERALGAFRHGGQIGEDAYFRVYSKYFSRDAGELRSGGEGNDEWEVARAGFRGDWYAGDRDTLSLLGDVYGGQIGERFSPATLTPPYTETDVGDAEIAGGNLVARWSRALSESEELSLQAFYDGTRFDDPRLSESRHTADLEFQHRFRAAERHEIVWGAGYRQTWDDIEGSPTITLTPEEETDRLLNLFVEDTITLVEDELDLTIGSKFEHNDYTGFEIQPSARVLWQPTARQTVWASVARAVRTPSRAEAGARIRGQVLPPGTPENPGGLPALVVIVGNEDLEAEELLAYELGYRVQPVDRLTFDIAAFYNDYENLVFAAEGAPSVEMSPTPHVVVPLIANNLQDAEVYGLEVLAEWQAQDWWRLQATYSYIELDLDPAGSAEGHSPQNRFSVRSLATLPHDVTFDLALRYVDDLPEMDVDSYVTLDARLAWSPTRDLEVAIVGQNLLEEDHFEFGSEELFPTVPTAVERSVYFTVKWRF